MKILSIVSEYFPHGSGIANAAFYLNKILQNLGHEIDVIHPGCFSPGYRPNRKYGIVSLLSFWKSVHPIIEIRGSKYDVIFLHQPYFTKMLRIKKPVITLFHVTYYGKWRAFETFFPYASETLFYRVSSIVERSLLRKMLGSTRVKIAVAAISNTVAQEIRQISSVENVHVIPFGVEPSLGLKSTDECGNPHDTIRIIWIGRLTRVKNPEYAIELFSRFISERKNVQLTFVGDGTLRGRLTKLSRKKTLDNKIRFVGRVSHGEALSIMRQHDLVLSTSVYEGLPVSILESIMTGLPPVVSNIPSLREIVNHNKVGCIFPLKDKDFAAKQVIEYLSSSKYFRDRESVSKGLAMRYQWSEISKQYDDLLSSFCS